MHCSLANGPPSAGSVAILGILEYISEFWKPTVSYESYQDAVQPKIEGSRSISRDLRQHGREMNFTVGIAG